MSLYDEINLEISMGTDAAKSDIKELGGELKRIDKIISSINNKKIEADISGGDLDKLLSNAQKTLKEFGRVRSGLERDIEIGSKDRTKARGMEDALTEFTKSMNEVSVMMANHAKNFAKESVELQRKRVPKSRVPGGPSWGTEPFPEKVDLDTRRIQRDKQKITSRVTSSVSGMQRAADSGELSYRQAKVLQGDVREIMFGATGASPEDIDKVRDFARGKGGGIPQWEVKEESAMHRAQEGIKDTSNEIHSLTESLMGLEDALKQVRKVEDGYELDANKRVVRDEDGNKKKKYKEEPLFPSGSEERNQQLLAIEKTREDIQKQQKLREENKNLLTEIVDGVNRIDAAEKEFMSQTGGDSVDVRARKGTFKEALASRANAIALSIGTAAMFSVKSAITEGMSTVESQRRASQEIGYSTGNYDFRGIRQEARAAGTHMGYTGDDMFGFGQSVMGSLGYTSETRGITSELARAEKFMGASEGAMEGIFESMLRTGSVDTAEGARELTEAISGGILASGMVGREDEQLAALQSILDEQATGRQMSSEEMKSQMAIINALSGTGNKALQGENLQKNLGTLQANIAATDPFSFLGFHMGVGTDPYFTGEGGMFNFMSEVEKGLGSEKVISGLESVMAQRGEGATLDLISQMPQFAGLSTDAMREIAEAIKSGDLNATSGGELQKELMAGAERLDASEEGYDWSTDRIHEEKDALRDARKANMADNQFVDAVGKFQRAVEAFGAESPAKAFGVTAATGAATGFATGAIGALSLGLSGLFKGIGTTSTTVTGMGGAAAGAGKIGLLARASEEIKMAGMMATGKLSSIGETMVPGLTGEMASGILNKSLLAKGVIGTGVGAYKVATADRKGAEAVSQVGDVGGGLVGAWGGAKAAGLLGAKFGTAMGPLGTLIGGGIGMAAGGFAGSKLGKGVGDWAAGKWFGGTDEQHAALEAESAVYSQQQDVAEQQQDVSIASSKSETESRRSDNVHKETSNLSEWDRLVAETKVLLDTARRQNGIIGSASAAGGTASGGTGVGGSLGTVGRGSHWTSSNIRKHDVTKTSSGLTSEQLDAWISDKAPGNSKMVGMGSAFMEAGNQHGVDPRMLVGLAAHESGWGTSNFARNRNNFFGMNAQTNNPGRAFSYDSPEEGIMAAADTLRRLYIEEGRTDLDSIGPKYAADPLWSSKVANTMAGSEGYVSQSQGDVNVNTTVNVKSSGDNKRDAKSFAEAISSEVNKNVGKNAADIRYNRPIPSMYVNEMRKVW